MAENDPQTPPTITPPPSSTPPPGAPPPANPDSQARMWNMWCHLSALAGFVVPLGFVIGPLLVWQIKKNEFPSVDYHGKMALNFQITVAIAIFALVFVGLILLHFCIGIIFFPLASIVGILDLVFTIIAGIKANNGEDYRYPYSLELIK